MPEAKSPDVWRRRIRTEGDAGSEISRCLETAQWVEGDAGSEISRRLETALRTDSARPIGPDSLGPTAAAGAATVDEGWLSSCCQPGRSNSGDPGRARAQAFMSDHRLAICPKMASAMNAVIPIAAKGSQTAYCGL